MQPKPSSPPRLLSRWLELTTRAVRDPEGALETVLEALAMTVALETVGQIDRAPRPAREALRRAGARALLQTAAVVSRDDEDAEAVRLVLPYARDGLRALSGRAPPATSHERDLDVLDADLAGLVTARFDGFRLAEIATRVRASAAARRALATLLELQDGTAAEPWLRLAADGPAEVRDPARGQKVGELRLGARIVEVYSFEDETYAAYADGDAVVHLSGQDVQPTVSRSGYAEARVGPTARVLEVRSGEEHAVLKLDGAT